MSDKQEEKAIQKAPENKAVLQAPEVKKKPGRKNVEVDPKKLDRGSFGS